MELIAGCLVIVAIRHSMNHNHETCIWQLWVVTLRHVARPLPQSRCPLLVTLPSLLSRLPNLSCTLFQKHLNPLSLNPFGIIKIFPRQAVLNCQQKICTRRLPVQGSISPLLQMVLSPDNGLMLRLQIHSHPYFLALVKRTKVGLLLPFAKMLQGEFLLLQPNWGVDFGPAQVRQIVGHTLCIIFFTGNCW